MLLPVRREVLSNFSLNLEVLSNEKHVALSQLAIVVYSGCVFF